MALIWASGGLAAGFLAGLFTFRIKNNWCERCGATKHCPDCSPAGRSQAGRSPAGRSRAGGATAKEARP